MGLDITSYRKLIPVPSRAELIATLEQLGRLQEQYPDLPHVQLLSELPVPPAELGRIADWLLACLGKRENGESFAELADTVEGLIVISGSLLEYTEKYFPGRTQGLSVGTFSYEERFGFNAGSYTGYNEWRDWLSRAAGHGAAKSLWERHNPQGPFVELINFADNEGVIGPVVSLKLAMDFAEHKARIEATAPDESYVESYQNWAKAFALAADSGAVDFH
jgi:hypothetical protein